MRELTATKSLTYATRRYLAGENFSVKTERDARVLIAIKKAAPRRTAAKIEAPPVVPKTAAPSTNDALTKLREEYAAVVGKKPWHGWDEAELRKRIDEAKQPVEAPPAEE